MRLLIMSLVALVICGNAIASAPAESGEDELRQRIDEANAVIDSASIKNDYETIASFYTEDVVILPNHEPMIIGRDAFIENEKAVEEAGFKLLEIESSITSVFQEGNLVHEIGAYEIKLEVPGAPFPITDTGKYLVIWEIQPDESVKIKLEMWNNDELPEY
jgi:ketosteroid isomerase-like protein